MMICRNKRSKGIKTRLYMRLVTKEAKVMTKITAMPIPKAVSTLRETPKKGQMPKNLVKTKLFTKMALKKITNRLAIPAPKNLLISVKNAINLQNVLYRLPSLFIRPSKRPSTMKAPGGRSITKKGG